MMHTTKFLSLKTVTFKSIVWSKSVLEKNSAPK